MNSADLKTLDTLPGVGPVLAQRIIEGRPYKTFADLERVKGLGKAKLEDLKGKVIVGPGAVMAQSAAKKNQEVKAMKGVEARPPQPASSPAVRNPGTAGSNATLASLTASARRAPGKLAPGQKININKATAAELDALPGIGPTRAEAIVAFRTLNGNFKAIEDIQKVKGIKAASFDKLKDYIKVAD